MEKIGKTELMLYWQPVDADEDGVVRFLYVVGVFDGHRNEEIVFDTRAEAERHYAKLKRKLAAKLAAKVLGD